MKLRHNIALVLLFAFASAAVADSEAMPVPVVFASPSGSHYFRLIPSSDFDESKAEGFLYKVAAESDELLYQVKGWYSFTVLVSNDGEHLVRTGSWPRFGSLPARTVALVFYSHGKQSRVYFVTDLIKDVTALERSVSHYSWGGGLEWSDNGWDNLVQVRTVEDETIVFDIRTGDLVR